MSYLDLSRPKPYDRPQRPSDRMVSPIPDCQPAHRDPLPAKQIDPSTFARLFQQLMPIAINEPLGFESKASAICASFDLDHATSADIINSVKQQFPAIRNQEAAYVLDPKPALRALSLTSVLSALPAPGGPTDVQPITNSTSAIPVTSPGPAVPPLMPLKQQRAFTSGPRGFTTWYSTQSPQSLSTPPLGLQGSAGVLYVHTDTSLKLHQAWLCDTHGKWITVTGVDNVKHPTISDRFLLVRSDGIPSWLTRVDHVAIQTRRERAGK